MGRAWLALSSFLGNIKLVLANRWTRFEGRMPHDRGGWGTGFWQEVACVGQTDSGDCHDRPGRQGDGVSARPSGTSV